MIEDSVYPTNGSSEAASSAMTEVDSLLMYQAKQNIKDKKNLIKHVIVFISMFPVLGIFYGGILDNMTHPSWWSASTHINRLNALRPYLAAEEETAISGATSFMTAYFRHNHVPDIWYVVIGVMLAWGCWISVRIAKRAGKPIARMLRAKITKKAKPDPVIQEYNRLKSMVADEAM